MGCGSWPRLRGLVWERSSSGPLTSTCLGAEHEGMAFEVSELVSGRNATLAGAAFVAVALLKNLAPGFVGTRVGKRLLPVLPVLLCIVGAFLGFADPAMTATWQDKMMVGLLSGATSAWLFKMGKTTVLGRGLDLSPSSPSVPPPAPEVETPPESDSQGGA